MISRYRYRGGMWLDLEKPTEEEMREIVHEYAIGERIEKEMFSPSPAPTVIDGGDMILLELHFPIQGAECDETENQEVDFLIGKHFIITTRYEVVAPIHHLKKLLETRDLVTGHESVTTDVLLEILFAHLYSAVRDRTNHITDRLERVEREMFDGHERATVRTISNISRAFLHLEADLASQEEPLSRFLKSHAIRNILNESFEERAGRILEELQQVMRLIKTHRAVATEMRETNSALLESRQNEIIKVLMVITFIFLPLELITFIFSMHVPGTPIVENPEAFWIIIGSMAIIGAVITGILAKKHWIF